MMGDAELEDRTSYLAWSVVIGVVLPILLYSIIVLVTADGEGLSAPVSRGQLYLAAIGLIMLSIRRLVDEDSAVSTFRRRKTVMLALQLGSFATFTLLWALLTVQSINSKTLDWNWEIMAWLGAACVAFTVWNGLLAIAIVHRYARRHEA
jgi:hypothetical protein